MFTIYGRTLDDDFVEFKLDATCGDISHAKREASASHGPIAWSKPLPPGCTMYEGKSASGVHYLYLPSWKNPTSSFTNFEYKIGEPITWRKL